jgi:hypothetical protein
VIAHNLWLASIGAGPTIPSEMTMRIVVGSPGVAVALAAVMILRSHVSTAMADVMGTVRTEWCLISGRIATRPESVSATADIQDQGRRTIGGSGGEAAVETKIMAGRPGIGIVITTVTTSPRVKDTCFRFPGASQGVIYLNHTFLCPSAPSEKY